MQYIHLVFFLGISLSGMAQSKKELRASIATNQHTIDSLHQQLTTAKHRSDSLAKTSADFEQRYLHQLEITRNEMNDHNRCKQRVSFLEEENLRLVKEAEAAKAPATKTKATTTPPKPQGASTKTPDDNPFMSNSGRNEDGKGRGIGNDNGEGQSMRRFLIAKPQTNDIKTAETCKIVYIVEVDASGQVVAQPKCKTSQTTTTDQELIGKVANLVYHQTRYNKVEGATNQLLTVTIYVEGGE